MDCGGPDAPLHRLSASKKSCRLANGCDEPIKDALYDITCVRCNGLYDDCELCDGTGRTPIHRCPSSHQTPNMARALRAYAWMQKGVLPAAGAYGDQSPSFLAFVHIIEDEIAVIRDSDERSKSSLRAAMASAKRKR